MTSWAALPALPAVVGGYAASADSAGRIVLTGGFRSGAVQSDAVRFDPSSNAWAQLANLPGGLAQHAQALDDQGDLYVYGGFNGSVSVGAIRRYNKTSGQWDSAPQQMNRPRAGLAGCSDQQGRLYALGGSGTSVNNTCERYTRSTDTWSFIASLPGGARQGCRAVTDPQNRIYLIGGSANDAQSSRVERYIPSTNTWETLASLNVGREAPGVAIANGKVYVYGGYILQNSSLVPTSTVEVYDPTANTWSYTTSMSIARAEIMGASDVQGRMYAAGGYSSAGNAYVASAERNTENAAPNAAIPTTPTSGSSVDRTTAITLAWVFNDPDAGDSQSKSDIRYKLTSASSWTTILGATTTATSYALPANQTAGDYEWQVLTYDALGVASPWSASSFFTAANPPGTPVITAPPVGGTIATASYTATWSSPQQDAYEVRRVADNAGSPNASTVFSATGTVEDATSRARTLTFETNNRTEHVQVRVRYSGIWSQWATARVLVSYTPPATPVVVLTPQDATASILVTITNPAPSGSQPTVASHDILIDDGLGDGLTRRATGWPPGNPFTYWLSRSGRDYSGNIKVVAVATNGTTSTGTAT